MHLVIHAAILAIDVVVECGPERKVVEGGVEDLLMSVVRGLHPNLGELGTPGGMGLGSDPVEVPGIAFGLEIFGTARGTGT